MLPLPGPFARYVAVLGDHVAEARRCEVLFGEQSASSRVPGLQEVVGLALGPDGDGLDVLGDEDGEAGAGLWRGRARV